MESVYLTVRLVNMWPRILFVMFLLLPLPTVMADSPIPQTIEEAFSALDALLTVDQKAEFKKTPEKEATAKAHMGIGRYIRNEWLLCD